MCQIKSNHCLGQLDFITPETLEKVLNLVVNSDEDQKEITFSTTSISYIVFYGDIS